jgi:hypothetical protein
MHNAHAGLKSSADDHVGERTLTTASRWASVATAGEAHMPAIAIISILGLALGVLGGGASTAAFAQEAGASASSALEVSAQSRRARTRIRVSPAYPYRTYSTTYPVPYKYEYPGPGAVRQCTSWLATENRVSGPVIVPRMRCWWERG